MTDLHAEIMNLPCNVSQDCTPMQRLHFKLGHKDARHAAAELAIKTAAPQPAQVPEGYRLVPLEPTEAMLLAGQEAQNQACYRKPQPAGQEWAGVYYRAMLDAAPK